MKTTITSLSQYETNMVCGGDLPTEEEVEAAVDFAEDAGEVAAGFLKGLGWNKKQISIGGIVFAALSGGLYFWYKHKMKHAAGLKAE